MILSIKCKNVLVIIIWLCFYVLCGGPDLDREGYRSKFNNDCLILCRRSFEPRALDARNGKGVIMNALLKLFILWAGLGIFLVRTL